MIPAVDSTVTLTFANVSAALQGPWADVQPKTIELTGKVMRRPHWVKNENCFGFFVANTPVPLRVINIKDVLKIDGAENTVPAQESKVETFEVAGSKGSVYTVTNENGRWACTCVGFGFRKDCKHIHQVKR
jgi:hypothetical protein